MDENTEADMKDMFAENMQSLKELFRETPSMEHLLQIVATYHGMKQTERGNWFCRSFHHADRG